MGSVLPVKVYDFIFFNNKLYNDFKLSIVKAHCEIDELDLDLHGTRRDWFYTVMGPLVRKRVKSALELAVERNLLSLMD